VNFHDLIRSWDGQRQSVAPEHETDLEFIRYRAQGGLPILTTVLKTTVRRTAMSPLSLLIDHSQLLNRVDTLYSFAPEREAHMADNQPAAQETDAKRDERIAQIKGLIGGTLLFMPFLAAYLIACASR
jgi:hypothetical protein